MPALPPICLDTLAEITGGDQNFLQELWTQFLKDANERIPRLRRAIQGSESSEIELISHSLAGSAGCLAAAPLRQRALDLEFTARQGDLSVAEGLLDALEEEFNRLIEFFPYGND